MEKKITIADNFATVIAFVKANGGSDEMVAFLEDRKAKSIKKKATSKKVDNSANETLVLQVLERIGKGTVTDIQRNDETLASLSNQKVSAVLRPMVKDGIVLKNTEKGKTIFSLADNSDDDEE